MTLCPKHAWGGVKATLHSVLDQIDTDAVHAPYDKLLDNVTGPPDVQAHLDSAREEVREPRARSARNQTTTITKRRTPRHGT